MFPRTRFIWLAALSILVCNLVPAWCASPAGEPDNKPAVKVTYDEDVRPILRQNCFTCHNQNQAKSGLAMDSYAANGRWQ